MSFSYNVCGISDKYIQVYIYFDLASSYTQAAIYCGCYYMHTCNMLLRHIIMCIYYVYKLGVKVSEFLFGLSDDKI